MATISTQRVQQFRTRQRTGKILLTIEVDEVDQNQKSKGTGSHSRYRWDILTDAVRVNVLGVLM